MIHTYKTELNVNNVQRTTLLRHAGAARFAYNWGLSRRIEEYEKTGKSSNAIDQHKQLNVLKKTDFPWMYDVSKCAPQEALRDLDKAFKSFWQRCKQGAKRKGFPRFKSRHRSSNRFRLNGSIKVESNQIRLPRIGWLRLKERGYIPTNQKILSVTVSEKAGHWFISVQVDTQTELPKTKAGTIIGIDLGIKSMAVTSDGTVFENLRSTRKHESKLRKLNKQLSRRLIGGRNRAKTKIKLSHLHWRTACVRQDSIHKATTEIIRKASVIGIESLNVSGMVKNRCLAKAVSDASMAEFLRQLKYKAEWNGVQVVEADRFYPSSKTCHSCGNVKKDLNLSDREYICEICGITIDRDLNAALNLEKLAASSAVSAYSLGSSGSQTFENETTDCVGTKHLSDLSENSKF